MSVHADYSETTAPQLRTELDDGRSVTVEIVGSPDNKKRIDVRVANGRHWVFAVEDRTAALIMTLNEQGHRIDDGLPSWMEPTLQQLGLEGVEQ